MRKSICKFASDTPKNRGWLKGTTTSLHRQTLATGRILKVRLLSFPTHATVTFCQARGLPSSVQCTRRQTLQTPSHLPMIPVQWPDPRHGFPTRAPMRSNKTSNPRASIRTDYRAPPSRPNPQAGSNVVKVRLNLK